MTRSFLFWISQYLIYMIQIQKYKARRVKDGALVSGYAAVGAESGVAWIMIPTAGTDNQFHCVEVDGETLEEL